VNLFRRLPLLISFLGILTFAPAASQDAPSKIKSEIGRLEQSLKDKLISDANVAQIGTMASTALQSSSQALEAGRLYLSLEELARAEDLLGGARSVVDRSSRVKSDLPAFEAEWGAASLRLTALDREAHDRTWEHTPAAIRALSESSQGKAIPLLDGARGFATANGPSDGLFYMGQAEALADFAGFCARLELPAAKEKFPLRSFLPELQALQSRTNAAFQPPKSIQLHSRFIALNSTIKLAEELDSSRFYAGALYQYLEAVRHYGMVDAAPLDPAGQTRLKKDLTTTRKMFDASARDDSIAQLFLNRAESQIAHADGSAPAADEWRSAQVILDQVLPAYEAARHPATPLQTASGKTVEITLVRWPYT